MERGGSMSGRSIGKPLILHSFLPLDTSDTHSELSMPLLLSLMDWAYATLIPHKFDNNCMRLVLSVSSGAGIFCGGGSPSPVLLSDGTSGGVSPVVQQLHSLDVDVFSRSKWPSCTVECWLPPFMCGRKCASNKYVSDVRRRLIFLIKCFTLVPFQLTSCYLCSTALDAFRINF